MDRAKYLADLGVFFYLVDERTWVTWSWREYAFVCGDTGHLQVRSLHKQDIHGA